MPVPPTYPGVYIEEVPSGVRTITGVATAITAFIGRAPRGPVDWPVRIQNFGDYGRAFGGLSLISPVSFAVQQFFNNGGTDAIVVRVYEPPATATGVGSLTLAADMRARGTLTLRTQPDAAETLTLGDVVYTFVDGLPADATTNAIEVQIGLTLDETQANLANAINATGTPGVGYSAEATANPAVSAAKQWVDDLLVITARGDGTDGNDIVSTATFGDTNNGFASSTLSGGRATVGAVQAEATLTLATGNPPADSTITIGTRTYTLRANGTTPLAALDIELGTGIADTRANIIAAINAVADEVVTAALDGTSIVLTAKAAGLGANTIVIDTDPQSATFTFDGSTLGATTLGADGTALPSIRIDARNPGAWANNLRLTVNHDVADPTDADAFNLLIEEINPSLPAGAPPAAIERFLNLSMDPESPRFVEATLAARSQLVRTVGTTTERPGVASGVPMDGGSDGLEIDDNTISNPDLAGTKQGLWALENADLFNILCIPPLTFDADIGPATRAAALKYCKDRRAFYVVDPPGSWVGVPEAEAGVDGLNLRDENAAVYFPRVDIPNPLRDNQLSEFVPCGVIAGLYARTDAQRGVWKAPAGTDATLSGVQRLAVPLTDAQNGRLNPLGVNSLRSFPVIGNVAWGARTLEGADQLASEWKYVPVRRTALFIEETLYRGLKWVVFEPNDEPLWSQIRLNVGSFMHTLFRQGAFQGSTPKDAYLVKCDSETTTQADIDRGVVNILVGFAPLKPAEFVFVRIQQLAGQLQT